MVATIGFLLVAVALIMIAYLKALQRENMNLVLQENLIKEHYSTLKYQMEQTRKLRHDIANHIYMIEQLSMQSEKKAQLASDYKNELEKTYHVLQSKTFCEELIVDSVIKNKLRECQQKQIKADCQAERFSIGDIEIIDMLGLLYNVFDNAIEACEKLDIENRWLNVSIKNEGGTFILLCHNSKNPDISLKNGQKTTKKDKENHGIGKDIMKSIVKKYHGSISAEDREEEYHLEIVCRCKSNQIQGES